MKKKILLSILSFLLAFCVLCSCSKRGEEQQEDNHEENAGVTITFETGFENVKVSPLHLDNTTHVYMPFDPFYAGYTFLGWYYDREGTKKFNLSDGFTEDTTLYAKWQQNEFSSGAVSGEEEEIIVKEGVSYRKSDDGYYIRSYSGDSETIVIPIQIGETKVVGILSEAFTHSSVKTIELPYSIKTIEQGAFSGAIRLSKINVHADNAFFRSQNGVLFNKEETTLFCIPQGRNMTTYTLPVNVQTISGYALYGGTYRLILDEAAAPLFIEKNAFSGFAGEIELTGAVRYIQKNAFTGATCKVTFAESFSISKLGNGEFDGYIGEKLILPAVIEEVSGAPFYDCTAEIDLSRTGLTALGDKAFYGYLGQKLVVPDSVLSLGLSCFRDCTSNVTFDERSAIQKVGKESFSRFKGTVTFPATINEVESNAFWYAQEGSKVIFSTKESQINISKTAFASSHATVTYR